MSGECRENKNTKNTGRKDIVFINKAGGAGIVFIDFSNEDPILGVGRSQEFLLVTNEMEYILHTFKHQSLCSTLKCPPTLLIMTIINCTQGWSGIRSKFDLTEIDVQQITHQKRKKRKKGSLIILGNNGHNLITQPYLNIQG